MFKNSVVDHNGLPSLPYVSLSMSFQSSMCITYSSSISSSSNNKSSPSSGSTSLSSSSTFLKELDSSVYLTDPVQPGLFYNHLCHSFIHSLRHSLMICENIFKHLHSQTSTARELKFWEKVHHPPPVTCPDILKVDFFALSQFQL